MSAAWVVVADRAVARLMRVDSPTAPLEEFEVLVHPESRMRAQTLTSDLPGRAFDSKGHGRHAMESGVGPRKQEAIEFARRVAARLEAARLHGEVEHLVLVAAPEFLGLLRKSLGPDVRKRVASEHPLDLVAERPEAIRQRLPERLYSSLG